MLWHYMSLFKYLYVFHVSGILYQFPLHTPSFVLYKRKIFYIIDIKSLGWYDVTNVWIVMCIDFTLCIFCIVDLYIVQFICNVRARIIICSCSVMTEKANTFRRNHNKHTQVNVQITIKQKQQVLILKLANIEI